MILTMKKSYWITGTIICQIWPAVDEIPPEDCFCGMVVTKWRSC